MLLGGGDDETAAPATTTAPPAVNTTVAPAATTTAPAPVTTIPSATADRQRAQRIVLTLAALPGYENEPSSADESDPAYEAALTACFNNNPLLGQFAKGQPARGVEGNEFRRPSGEYAVGSGVYFAESGDLARAAIRDASGATVAQCIARAERAAVTNAPGWTTVTVTTTRLPALSAGEENVGYRTVIRSHSARANRDVDFAYGVTLVRVDRAVIVLYDSSVDGQIPEAERVRLANLLATRAAAA